MKPPAKKTPDKLRSPSGGSLLHLVLPSCPEVLLPCQPLSPCGRAVSLVLTKGFGDISWTCAASILQRKEGENVGKVGAGQTTLTSEEEVTGNYLPPLPKQLGPTLPLL